MKRKPFLHWLLILATLGQYGFLWGFRLAYDVSRLTPATPIPVQKHARVFVVGYVLYLIGATILSWRAWRTGPSPDLDSVFWPVYILGVALVSHFVWLLTRIAKQLRTISHSDTPRSSTVVILSLLWMTSLPWLQSHANKHA